MIRQESVESSHIEATQDISQPVYDQPSLDQENWQKTYAEQQYQQPWQNVQQPHDYQQNQEHLGGNTLVCVGFCTIKNRF